MVGTLVIEAKVNSGTSITAGYAKKFNRKVFCIPHAIEDKAGIGTNRLIKNGAILVTNPQEILKHLGCNKIAKIENKPAKVEISKEYEYIYNLLKNEDLSADEISRKTNTNIIEINAALTMMELEGYIENLPGNIFRIKR